MGRVEGLVARVTGAASGLGLADAELLAADALGAARDVAQMVLYLASPESRFVTGAEFLIDNGCSVRP